MPNLKMNQYPIWGGIVGFVFALVLLTFGFLKTLVLLLFVALGGLAGWYVQETGLLDFLLRRNK